MIDSQLIPRGITDKKVLEAFLKVPRHEFIPKDFRSDAYTDHPVPIGEGQTISQPYMVALMTQLLSINGGEKILEIGTGSGYQAAILSEMGAKVYTVERNKDLYEKAKAIFLELGYKNIECGLGDGTLGWPEKTSFDAIIVTAASPDIPEPLKDQLVRGGRLIIPVGPRHAQILVEVKRNDKDFSQKAVCGCVFVPLIGEYGWRDE